MSILIKKCKIKNKETDIFIEDNKIKEISKNISVEADHKIEAQNLAAVPAFVNAHTHAAMTLFRGYADDMPLMEWLEKKIWPNEAKLTEDLVYHGARLACLEMIKSGTTFFNDMYWHLGGTAKALKEMNMRGCVNGVFIDMFDKEKSQQQIKKNIRLYKEYKDYDDKIQCALGPHAIYTVSEESLLWIKDFAHKNNLPIHIHISETEQEVKDCKKKHKCTPVKYLDKINFLSDRVIAAHTVWINEHDAKILAKNKVTVVYNPVANMKLAVNNVFPYRLFKKHKVNICLGTDGASSNNNLSMFDTMKIASLLQKHHTADPTILSAPECFDMATKNAYQCFNLDIGLKEGKLADFSLLNLKDPALVPGHKLISDIVYAANNSCVDTVVCDGNILMQNRKVENEDEIIQGTRDAAEELLGL